MTGLRFFLALWVIVHHLTGKNMLLEAWVQTLPEPVKAFLHGGYVAVGTFFVLSGFVLARAYADTAWDTRNLLKYGAARIARVYPVYLLSLVIISPFVLEYLGTTRAPAEENAKLLANYGFVLQGWSSKLPVHWNTPAWSLSCEFFFYLCFPVIAALLSRARWQRTLVAVACAACIPFVLDRAGVPGTWKPMQHLADFLMGIATADAYGAWKHKVSGYWLYLPAALIGTLIVANPQWTWHWMVLNTALRPFNGMLLLGLAIGGGLPVQALSNQVAEFLGKASYSMYILHVPLLWWYKRSWIFLSGTLASTSSAVVYLGMVIGVSSVVCQWFEEPANRFVRSWVSAKVRRPSDRAPEPNRVPAPSLREA